MWNILVIVLEAPNRNTNASQIEGNRTQIPFIFLFQLALYTFNTGLTLGGISSSHVSAC